MLVRVWVRVCIGVWVIVYASVILRASVCGCVCVVRVCMCAYVNSCVGACEDACRCGSVRVWVSVRGCMCVG